MSENETESENKIGLTTKLKLATNEDTIHSHHNPYIQLLEKATTDYHC